MYYKYKYYRSNKLHNLKKLLLTVFPIIIIIAIIFANNLVVEKEINNQYINSLNHIQLSNSNSQLNFGQISNVREKLSETKYVKEINHIIKLDRNIELCNNICKSVNVLLLSNNIFQYIDDTFNAYFIGFAEKELNHTTLNIKIRFQSMENDKNVNNTLTNFSTLNQKMLDKLKQKFPVSFGMEIKNTILLPIEFSKNFKDFINSKNNTTSLYKFIGVDNYYIGIKVNKNISKLFTLDQQIIRIRTITQNILGHLNILSELQWKLEEPLLENLSNLKLWLDRFRRLSLLLLSPILFVSFAIIIYINRNLFNDHLTITESLLKKGTPQADISKNIFISYLLNDFISLIIFLFFIVPLNFKLFKIKNAISININLLLFLSFSILLTHLSNYLSYNQFLENYKIKLRNNLIKYNHRLPDINLHWMIKIAFVVFIIFSILLQIILIFNIPIQKMFLVLRELVFIYLMPLSLIMLLLKLIKMRITHNFQKSINYKKFNQFLISKSKFLTLKKFLIIILLGLIILASNFITYVDNKHDDYHLGHYSEKINVDPDNYSFLPKYLQEKTFLISKNDIEVLYFGNYLIISHFNFINITIKNILDLSKSDQPIIEHFIELNNQSKVIGSKSLQNTNKINSSNLYFDHSTLITDNFEFNISNYYNEIDFINELAETWIISINYNATKTPDDYFIVATDQLTNYENQIIKSVLKTETGHFKDKSFTEVLIIYRKFIIMLIVLQFMLITMIYITQEFIYLKDLENNILNQFRNLYKIRGIKITDNNNLIRQYLIDNYLKNNIYIISTFGYITHRLGLIEIVVNLFILILASFLIYIIPNIIYFKFIYELDI